MGNAHTLRVYVPGLPSLVLGLTDKPLDHANAWAKFLANVAANFIDRAQTGDGGCTERLMVKKGS
jgi:hypothetical protein